MRVPPPIETQSPRVLVPFWIHHSIRTRERERERERERSMSAAALRMGLSLASATADGIMTRVPQMTRDAYLMAHLPTPPSYYYVFVRVALERVRAGGRGGGARSRGADETGERKSEEGEGKKKKETLRSSARSVAGETRIRDPEERK